MRVDKILWGIILLFIGTILLLENFNVIEFYWGSVWRFWPVFLIIAGVNILFSKSKSPVGSYLSIGLLVVMLGVLFYRGVQGRDSERSASFRSEFSEENQKGPGKTQTFDLPFEDEIGRKTTLNVRGGGTSYEVKGETDNLFSARVEESGRSFSLTNHLQDSLRTLTFKMNNKQEWKMGEGGNDVDLRLNLKPVWTMNMDIGAGKVDFDLRPYKVREFNFDGGAAALDIKFGDLLPITDVDIETGVADVKLHVPMNSGCRITSKSGLSAKNFDGFTKMKNGTYETANYSTSSKKIFISLNGGLSNFEVKRY